MLTRRKFIGTTIGAAVALATGGRTALAQPARKRMIVDAQVHLWKANTPEWPWVPGAKPQLPEPFTIERALPLMDEAGVDRVVIVPPALNDRNDYALEAAKRHPNRFAVMGRIPLQDPKSAELLPRWKEPGMLGVRLTFNTPATIAWLSAPAPGVRRVRAAALLLGTDVTNAFARATWRQRVTHFTEELRFLSESDKDWVMGRAILQRLKWA